MLMVIPWKVVGLLRLQIFLTSALQQATGSTLIPLDNCICSGHKVTYQCTVCGEGATAWTGSLFDCPGDNIILRHVGFYHENISVTGECNNRALIARSIGIITKNCTPCFISQLSFSANIVIGNDTIECVHIDGTTETIVDITTIAIITTEPAPPPTEIHLIDITQTYLLFHWNQISWAGSGSCSSLIYNIIASNCGTCPNSTTSLFATCTNMTINGEICSFAVETEVCGNIIGQRNNSITVYLDVPDTPKVEAKQLFSSTSLSVIYSMINIVNPINISNGVDGSAFSYTITYYSLITGNICSRATIPVPSDFCVDGVCRHIYDSSSSVCDSDTHFAITAFATNVFGDGPTSKLVYVNITNTQFFHQNDCNYSTDSLNHSSFGVLLATGVGSIALLILIISSILFITAISILAKFRAKITRDLNQEQEATNRTDYEEVEINQRSEPSIISTMDNIAYDHISPINCD